MQWPRLFVRLDWTAGQIIVSHGIVIGLMASLDTLIATGSLEADSNQRARPNRELVVHGVANLLGGAVGLLPIVGSLTRTKLAWSAGSRTRWGALLHAAMLLALVLFGAQWLARLPVLAAAAVMIAMALDMIDDWSRQLVRLSFSSALPRRLIADATWLLVAVSAVTVVTGKPDRGFEAGCAIALFVWIRRRQRLAVMFACDGDRLVARLRGVLTNMNVDRMLIGPLLSRAVGHREVELDLRELAFLDASACKALRQITSLLLAKGILTRCVTDSRKHEVVDALFAFDVGADIATSAERVL